MVALDTNILARFYVDDPVDPEADKQRPIARRLLSASPQMFVGGCAFAKGRRNIERDFVAAVNDFDFRCALAQFDELLGAGVKRHGRMPNQQPVVTCAFHFLFCEFSGKHSFDYLFYLVMSLLSKIE